MPGTVSKEPVQYVDPALQEEQKIATELPEEELEAIKSRMKALDELLGEKGLAKYKLEVMFGKDHSLRKPTGGMVSFWESGNKLHGGGDSKLYVCDSMDPKKTKGPGCGAFIPDSANGLNFIVCPACGKMWKNDHITGEYFYKLPIQSWADVLLKWFLKLEMNADIRVKYHKDDIRNAAAIEQEKEKRGEVLGKARSFAQRPCYIYPLRNIIKDTSAGADLRGRILAFLTA